MTNDELLVARLRSGISNADKGSDGVRELGGVVLTMTEAADRLDKLKPVEAEAKILWDLLEEIDAQIDLAEEISPEFAEKVQTTLWGST